MLADIVTRLDMRGGVGAVGATRVGKAVPARHVSLADRQPACGVPDEAHRPAWGKSFWEWSSYLQLRQTGSTAQADARDSLHAGVTDPSRDDAINEAFRW